MTDHTNPGLGQSMPGYPEIIDVRGYDPVRHNLFGLDVLYQADRWIDAEGTEHQLETMMASHRRNLLAWLRRRAAGLEFRDALLTYAGPFAPRGVAACDAVEMAMAERCEDPAGWLESTPLVTRLRELVEADTQAEAERAAAEVMF